MNRTIFRKNVSDRWKATAIYAGALVGYLLMIIAVYPTFKETLEKQTEFLKDYPKGVMQFFGVEELDASSFSNYMTVEMFGLIWVIIMAAFVIAWTRAMVSGEIHDGTMELLLAQPVARWKVLVSQTVALLGGIVVVAGVTVLSSIAFGAAFKAEVVYSGFAAFLPLGICLSLAIAGYSLLFSTIFDQPRRAAMAAAGLTLLFYLVHFGGIYSKVIEKIDWFSIFHYYNPMEVLESGNLPTWDILALLLFAVVGFGAAIWVFQGKDIH